MLKQIINSKLQEVKQEKQKMPIAALIAGVQQGNHALYKALATKEWSLIAECKLASPAKGQLSDLSVGELAGIYQANGAAALSVLTDRHFKGEVAHIADVQKASTLPVIRKDFIIDEYQLYQARAAGADAVLLIAGILADSQLKRYLTIAAELGMDCLVEVHSREELERVQQTPARIIGVNNRDLRTFATSIDKTFALLPFCDPSRLLISESGIQTQGDAERLKAAGVRGALVGEGLVKADNIPRKVRELSLQHSREE
ncbi:MAG: indole-3-glycerol phosphate synthase TrpC [Negativicutes bacterium]|nr:indole-3-glycerol phosphate synthase TrpC [Negativicutes bacterium]